MDKIFFWFLKICCFVLFGYFMYFVTSKLPANCSPEEKKEKAKKAGIVGGVIWFLLDLSQSL
jgi:hypothetical protein